MLPKRTAVIVLVFCLTWAGLLTLVAFATNNNPPLMLFTDNIEATGSSPDVTVMEQALLNRLDAATVSIDATIYDFNRASIRDALIAAHNRGVAVRVVTDDDAYTNPAYNPYFAALETAGIPIVNDGRSSIMHNKFIVVDGEIVWTGSANLTDNGFTLNHNNSIVFTSTELADVYTIEFEEMFVDGLFGTAKSDNVTHTLTYKGIPLEVYFSPSDEAMAQILTAVTSADTSIHFSIFYFTDDDLRDAIIARMQAGVSVTGVWDNLGAANQYSEDEALCLAGAVIKREDFSGKMHNKFMIIDANSSDPVVITGSMNWSAAGDEANDENTLLIHDGEIAQTYLAAFQDLYNALGSETLCGGWLVYLPTMMKPGSSLPPTPTPSPTSTPMPTPQAADIHITEIVYNPDGDDVEGEYVRIENQGGVTADMTNWVLVDEANHDFIFPTFTLAPDAEVKVWTKCGTATVTDLYYCSGQAIWNNAGDTAFLRDSGGGLVDSCSYPGGGMLALCD